MWHFGAIGGCGSKTLTFSTRISLENAEGFRVAIFRPPAFYEGIPGLIRVRRKKAVAKLLQQLWKDERGQDIAEYAVMLAVILVIVVGTIRLIGSNANNVFSAVGSAIQ